MNNSNKPFLSSEPKDTDTDIDLDPGNDPDAVAGEVIPERALKAVGTKPGAKHEGSVKPLVEGQKDLEIASVVLNSSQVHSIHFFYGGTHFFIR